MIAVGTTVIRALDDATSPRWEANDRPSLNKAFDAAGIESDIQNAGGDKAKFGTICDG